MPAQAGVTTPPALPSGQVALFFSDIEGSTALLNDLGDAYGRVLDDHDAIMRTAFDQHGGVEVKNEGDAFFAAFADHQAAVAAAIEVQRRFEEHPWPARRTVKVRIGLHAGRPLVRGHDYWGIDVHYAARVAAAAHGGQILVTDLMRRAVPSAHVVSVGQHALKDFPAPRELFHLLVEGHQLEEYAPPRTLSTHRNNLPTIYGPLYGRAPVVGELARRLTGGDRLVSVVGPGGMGKTRLVIATAERLAPDFSDGVAFVSLATAEDDRRAVHAIADAVGAAHGNDPEATLFAHLATRRMLLVLDNLEHLPGMAQVVSRLMEAAPGCRLLVTSQSPLSLRAERVAPLGPLDDEAAVAMFRDRAGSLDTEDTDEAAVLDLCRALDRVPLALELAAARVGLTGVTGLRAALDRDPDRALGTGPADLPGRQRGLKAVLEWTTGLLNSQERTVFAGLGAFAEAWTVERAEALFAEEPELDVWAALERLLALSLIIRRGDGRLTMAERTRRHARGQLLGMGDADRRRRGHAEILLDSLRPRFIEFTLDHRRGIANVSDDLSEILHAFDWARHNDLPLAARLSAWSSHMLGILGRRGALGGRGALLDFAPDPTSRALLMSSQSVGAARDDDPARSLALGQGAVDLVRTDPEIAIVILTIVAPPYVHCGLAGAALAASDEAISMAAGLTDPRWGELVEALRLIVLVDQGRFDEAWADLRSVARATERTDRNSLWAPSYLGDCALGLGEPAIALQYFRQQLSRLDDRALGSVLAQLQGVAAALARLGEDADAVELMAAVEAHSAVMERPDPPAVIRTYAVIVDEAVIRLGPRAAECRANGARWTLDQLLLAAHRSDSRSGSD